MDWYPQQLFTAEQAAAGAFAGGQKRRVVFQKSVVWGPQALFTAEHVAAGAFLSEKTYAFSGKGKF